MRYQRPWPSLIRFLAVIAATAWFVSPVQAQPETLTIAAANSLRDAFRKVLPQFEAQHPEINVRVIYGPSQTLRGQIEQGAPVDVFLPSLTDEIDELERKGLVLQGTKRVYAGTSLVLITGTTLPAPVKSISDLENVAIRRIAVGDPKTSSVGKVAAQFLKSRNLEPKLKSQYVFGEHSRAVVDLVAKGEAEVGVVYRTDAVSHPKIRVLDTAPAGSHTPVHYGVAGVWTSKNLSGSAAFIEFLLTPQIQDLLQEFGFDRAGEDSGLIQQQEVKP